MDEASETNFWNELLERPINRGFWNKLFSKREKSKIIRIKNLPLWWNGRHDWFKISCFSMRVQISPKVLNLSSTSNEQSERKKDLNCEWNFFCERKYFKKFFFFWEWNELLMNEQKKFYGKTKVERAKRVFPTFFARSMRKLKLK